MYSVNFNQNLIKGVTLIDINKLNPHEKIIEKKKSSLAKFIKSYEGYYIISSIVCCHESFLIIDGHHRYFALKELGFKKAPVTMIDIKVITLERVKQIHLKKNILLILEKVRFYLNQKVLNMPYIVINQKIGSQ